MNAMQEIISDEEIEQVHGHACFGSTSKRDVIAYALLKTACGFYSGSTARRIILDHGLVTPKMRKLTKKGRNYLWAAFGKLSV